MQKNPPAAKNPFSAGDEDLFEERLEETVDAADPPQTISIQDFTKVSFLVSAGPSVTSLKLIVDGTSYLMKPTHGMFSCRISLPVGLHMYHYQSVDQRSVQRYTLPLFPRSKEVDRVEELTETLDTAEFENCAELRSPLGPCTLVGIAYSGAARGVSDIDIGKGPKTSIHAEENAIFFPGLRDTATLFMLVTRPPCNQCARTIIASGIPSSHVIYLPDRSTARNMLSRTWFHEFHGPDLEQLLRLRSIIAGSKH